MSPTPPETPTESIDLRGVPCPANAAKALIKIATLGIDEILEVHLDAGEAMENLPPAIEEEGHEIIQKTPNGPRGWTVLIRVKS